MNNNACLIIVLILYSFCIKVMDCCVYGPSPECLFPCRCESDARCDPVTGECMNEQCRRVPPYDDNYGWNDAGCRRGNIAYSKQTSQSGVWRDYTSDRAVDGNTNPDADNGNSCAHPTTGFGGPPAWWMVDLGKKHVIDEIIIFNRNTNRDRTNDFYILIGMTQDIHDQVECAYFSDGNFRNFDSIPMTCDGGPVEGRYVTMQRALGSSNQHAINICEFVVLGYEPIDCGNNCNDTCHTLTGCTTCNAGFATPDCINECHDEFWGINCQNPCGNCSNNDVCNKANGECRNGCVLWYLQQTCNLYIEIPSLERALVEVNTISSAELKVEWNQFEGVKDRLNEHYYYKVEYGPTGSQMIISDIVRHDSNNTSASILLAGLSHNTEYEMKVVPYRVQDSVEQSGLTSGTKRIKTLGLAPLESPNTEKLCSCKRNKADTCMLMKVLTAKPTSLSQGQWNMKMHKEMNRRKQRQEAKFQLHTIM